MKSGHAATFADQVIRHNKRGGRCHFPDFDDFRMQFVKDFCPENESVTALMRLESARYFQGRRTVDAYIDEFVDLIELSGYTDPIAIVIKFRRGLSPAIQGKIAESGRDQPDDDHMEGWYRAARWFDLNRIANEAFHWSSTKATPHAATSATSMPRSPFVRLPPPNPPPAPIAKAPPPLPMGTPMDIDVQKSCQPTPQTCHRCGKVGHFIRDCPNVFDIRFMTADEQQNWMEEALTAADAVEPVQAEEEDFAARSE